jgi:hypothetical protein
LVSEPDAGFISVRSNFIVHRATDFVDVTGDTDRQQGLSALTTSLCRAKVWSVVVPSVIGQA